MPYIHSYFPCFILLLCNFLNVLYLTVNCSVCIVWKHIWPDHKKPTNLFPISTEILLPSTSHRVFVFPHIISPHDYREFHISNFRFWTFWTSLASLVFIWQCSDSSLLVVRLIWAIGSASNIYSCMSTFSATNRDDRLLSNIASAAG